jgi:ATP-dependent Lhr-like helicase
MAAPGPDALRVLATLDPANPYGALVPWPAAAGEAEARPRRVAGAWVVLVRGEPLAYAAPGGRQVLTFCRPETGQTELALAVRALAGLPRAGRRRSITVEQVDGVPIARSPLRDLFLEAGFEPDYRGLRAPAVR